MPYLSTPTPQAQAAKKPLRDPHLAKASDARQPVCSCPKQRHALRPCMHHRACASACEATCCQRVRADHGRLGPPLPSHALNPSSHAGGCSSDATRRSDRMHSDRMHSDRMHSDRMNSDRAHACGRRRTQNRLQRAARGQRRGARALTRCGMDGMKRCGCMSSSSRMRPSFSWIVLPITFPPGASSSLVACGRTGRAQGGGGGGVGGAWRALC